MCAPECKGNDTSHLGATVTSRGYVCNCGETFPTVGRGERRESPAWVQHAREIQHKDCPVVTYTVGHNEPLHPDPDVCARMREDAIGEADCEYGCKTYADPLSSVRVLAHNSNYGCQR